MPDDTVSKPTLPPDTLDLTTELVPAVRGLLARGLSDSFLRACVRIGEFETYSGGLKADLVGGLTLHVNAAIKLGGAELVIHASLMNAVNARRPGTFAEVLETVPLNGSRWLLLMAQLRKYETLFDLVFDRETTLAALKQALDKTFAGLASVHAIVSGTIPELGAFVETQDPYTSRVRSKLTATLKGDPALAPMLDTPGQVMGRACPPLGDLLARLEAWLARAMPDVPRVLIHGDPHLRNVMVRHYGKGVAARFIDPNPDYGYTDPAYDFGKLLHFAEPVGWAVARPAVCRGSWCQGSGDWTLDAKLLAAPQAPERRRAFLEQEIHARIARLRWARDATWAARLHVARASAHLGLLARFSGQGTGDARRFVLAHAVAALAAWDSEVTR